MDNKKWYHSRTIWANLISGVVSVLLVLGIDVGLDVEEQGAIVSLVMTLVNIVLRLDTKEEIDK
jgi:hypothetical protein